MPTLPSSPVFIPPHGHGRPRPFTRDDQVEQLTYQPERVDLIVVFPRREAEEFRPKLFGPRLIGRQV
jgi:hypothetical protein